MNNDADYWTIEAMRKFGGSFVQALAECAERADANNLSKLKAAFPEYFTEYSAKGRTLESKSEGTV